MWYYRMLTQSDSHWWLCGHTFLLCPWSASAVYRQVGSRAPTEQPKWACQQQSLAEVDALSSLIQPALELRLQAITDQFCGQLSWLCAMQQFRDSLQHLPLPSWCECRGVLTCVRSCLRTYRRTRWCNNRSPTLWNVYLVSDMSFLLVVEWLC